MKTSSYALLSLSLFPVVAGGCNPHELKPSELQHWGDEAGGSEDGDESGGDDGLDASGGEQDDESGGDDDGGGDDGGGVPTDCGGDTVVAASTPASLMLVLDKSGSMRSNEWDHDGDPSTDRVTRWNSLHHVVTDLVARYGTSIDMGAALFPALDAHHGDGAASACAMAAAAEIAIAEDNGDAIMATIPGADAEVAGGTPTRGGLRNALDHLLEVGDVGHRAIVLVTDGAANCVPGVEDFATQYDHEVPLMVGRAHLDHGITTYVVGIDIRDEPEQHTGRNVRDDINAVAEQGGAPRPGADRFYNTTNEAELDAAMNTIAQSVECTVTLDELPADPAGVELTIGGSSFEQVDTCEGADGWRFTNASAPWDTIELCGRACAEFRVVRRLDTTYPCVPVG